MDMVVIGTGRVRDNEMLNVGVYWHILVYIA